MLTIIALQVFHVNSNIHLFIYLDIIEIIEIVEIVELINNIINK